MPLAYKQCCSASGAFLVLTGVTDSSAPGFNGSPKCDLALLNIYWQDLMVSGDL
jgi:hypothetical protein